MRLVVTGGAGFIGSNFVRYMLAEHDDCRDREPRQAHLRRQPREPARRRGRPAATASCTGDICDAGRRSARRCAASTPSSTSPPRPTSTAPSASPQAFIQHRRPRHPHAARGGARASSIARFVQVSHRRGLRLASRTGSFTEDSTLDPRSPYSASKAGGDLLVLAYSPHLRHAGAHHARLQHLRPLPVPREAHPALRHQRARRQAAAALRRRPERARLALRGRPLRRHRPACCTRASPGEVYNIGGGNESHEPRDHAPHPRAARQGRGA